MLFILTLVIQGGDAHNSRRSRENENRQDFTCEVNRLDANGSGIWQAASGKRVGIYSEGLPFSEFKEYSGWNIAPDKVRIKGSTGASFYRSARGSLPGPAKAI